MLRLSDFVGFIKEISDKKQQVDKSGRDYFLHPIGVMCLLDMKTDKETLEIARIVALLHDVVEDNPEFTFDKLASIIRTYDCMVKPETVKLIIDSLKLLTKPTNMKYMDYIQNIIEYSEDLKYIPLYVKHADLKHNTSDERMKRLDENTMDRLYKKYTIPICMIEDKLFEIEEMIK